MSFFRKNSLGSALDMNRKVLKANLKSWKSLRNTAVFKSKIAFTISLGGDLFVV